MQIVIDIPKKMYEELKYLNVHGFTTAIEEAVANGTPLPKGHGKIADIDKVLEEMKVTRTYDIPFALGRVRPIIPADTESEE